MPNLKNIKKSYLHASNCCKRMREPGLACGDLDFIACLLHLFVHTCPTSSHLLQSSTLHMVSSRLPFSLPHWIDIIFCSAQNLEYLFG